MNRLSPSTRAARRTPTAPRGRMQQRLTRATLVSNWFRYCRLVCRRLSSTILLFVAACAHSPPMPPTGTVVVDNLNVAGLAVDATFLYWASPDGSVGKVPLDGSGGAIEIASGIQTRPVQVAVDAEFVYWATIGSLSVGRDGGVTRAPLAGGESATVVTGYEADMIALTSDFVYWADCASLFRMAKVQGVVETVFWRDCFGTEISSIAVDTTFAYLDVLGGPERLPLAGGTFPSPLSNGGPGGPGSLAVDATNVYWTVGTYYFCDLPPCPPPDHHGYVLTAPLGGGPTTLLATFTTPDYPVTPIAVDAMHVYWMTADSVQRIALAGGTVETIAEHQGAPQALVLDDTQVFWASAAVGEFPAAIRTVAK